METLTLIIFIAAIVLATGSVISSEYNYTQQKSKFNFHVKPKK